MSGLPSLCITLQLDGRHQGCSIEYEPAGEQPPAGREQCSITGERETTPPMPAGAARRETVLSPDATDDDLDRMKRTLMTQQLQTSEKKLRSAWASMQEESQLLLALQSKLRAERTGESDSAATVARLCQELAAAERQLAERGALCERLVSQQQLVRGRLRPARRQRRQLEAVCGRMGRALYGEEYRLPVDVLQESSDEEPEQGPAPAAGAVQPAAVCREERAETTARAASYAAGHGWNDDGPARTSCRRCSLWW
ncbi:uncharacterized protein LOC119108133 [Pollicipes pollicipes]|uniref:uncharacterized protein LOC119108133 n=1 Tax=Pollicipes pollicipes TaxID=41117 RepID=UPI001884AFD5|nr:uncharacterized protein LOC119108133 [Pollicipes pollicipes]